MTVASALISGVTPSRTLEKISIGSVVDPGPETKLAMTTSSSDSVKDSSQPEIMAGAIVGTVTSKNTRSGRPPRSMGRFFERLVHATQARAYDYRDVGHRKRHVRYRDRHRAACTRPADQIGQRYKEEQQRNAGNDFRHDER